MRLTVVWMRANDVWSRQRNELPVSPTPLRRRRCPAGDHRILSFQEGFLGMDKGDRLEEYNCRRRRLNLTWSRISRWERLLLKVY